MTARDDPEETFPPIDEQLLADYGDEYPELAELIEAAKRTAQRNDRKKHRD